MKSLNVQKPWRTTKGWKYPYTGINDPEYIKAKSELFRENGNGWWWGIDSELKITQPYRSSSNQSKWNRYQ